MDYEKKYNEALERMKSWVKGEHPECFTEAQKAAEFIFPELKESEDESIRTAILNHLKKMCGNSQDNVCGVHVEDAIAWLEKQSEQKTADKVEPKFHEGEWVVYECGGETATLQITRIVEETYVFSDDSTLDVVDEDTLRLWDITKDAKKGDVLRHNGCTFIFICIEKGVVKALEENLCNGTKACNFGEPNKDNDYSPATKEQRDLLFQKIKEAGYEWDAEKKGLKKIDDEEYNGYDYGIDSLFHAQRILEKTLGSVDGYQSDDGILEHKCAISAVKKLYEQKTAKWSEEDALRLEEVICMIEANGRWVRSDDALKLVLDWLNSIRPRIIGLK